MGLKGCCWAIGSNVLKQSDGKITSVSDDNVKKGWKCGDRPWGESPLPFIQALF